MSYPVVFNLQLSPFSFHIYLVALLNYYFVYKYQL